MQVQVQFMTLFHTCCETLHRSGGGRMKVNESRIVVASIGHSTGRRSLQGWGDTRVSPQPWREIDAHG